MALIPTKTTLAPSRSSRFAVSRPMFGCAGYQGDGAFEAVWDWDLGIVFGHDIVVVVV